MPSTKTTLPIILILLILILNSAFSFAAGSGGGGTIAPACTKDTWTCTGWSACTEESLQTRTCRLTDDCPSADTPKPEEKAPCEYVSNLLSSLKCQSQPTTKERVKCRIELPEQTQKETELNYLPEECISFVSIQKRESCVKRYISFRKCFTKDKDDNRKITCAKSVLNLGDLQSEIAKCNSKSQKEKASCTEQLTANIDSLIKFRFYSLEEEAEELMEENMASKGIVINFVADLESKKQEYNEAKTISQKKQIVLDVKKEWANFIKNIKTEDEK